MASMSGVGENSDAERRARRETPLTSSIGPSTSTSTFGSGVKKVAIRVKRATVEIFQDLVVAVSFTFLIAGMAILSGHKVIAMTTISCMTAVMYSLGPKFRQRVLKAASFALLMIEKIQDTKIDDLFRKPLAEEKKEYRQKINKMTLRLRSFGAYFPQNLEDLRAEDLEAINQHSYLQYSFGSGRELIVRILPQREDAKLKSKDELTEQELLDTLRVLRFKYPGIKNIHLANVHNLKTVTPLLKSFQSPDSPGLNSLVLERTDLHEDQIRHLFSKVNLDCLELIDCPLIDDFESKEESKGDTLWRFMTEKTVVFRFDREGTLIGANQDTMQRNFEAALRSKITSRSDETPAVLIPRFIEKLPQENRSGYYPLACLGVRLDLAVFSTLPRAENLAKLFLSTFSQAGFVVRELISPFVLDAELLRSITGMPVKCLKTAGISDYTALASLRHLEELHLDFDANGDIERLLAALPPHINRIVLQRKAASTAPSQPYLELVRVRNQSYEIKVLGSGLADGRVKPFNLLKKLRVEGIKISKIDLSRMGAYEDKSQNLPWLFGFCAQKKVRSLVLSNCFLENKDLEGVDLVPAENLRALFVSEPGAAADEGVADDYEGLEFLDLSTNPDIRHTDKQPIFQRWTPAPRASGHKIRIKIDTIVEGVLQPVIIEKG